VREPFINDHCLLLLPDLAPCFLKDIQEYIKQVFNSGNLDLNSKQNESLEKDDGSL
jgi:hypothetical protein